MAIYTIPPEQPFVDALAAGLAAEAGSAAHALARFTVFLPTRRACRSLREAFLRRSGGRPLLLPRLLPLGELDEDELAFLSGEEDPAAGGFRVPPALPGLRRQLLLTRLVLALEGRRISPDQAARLAAELARLLDLVRTERLDFARLADLVPEDFARHWQITLDFLRILTERWPEVLAEEGAVDPAERRNLLLEAQAAAWRRNPPRHPVVAAGSTGTLPATADLLQVVAGLSEGRVVLPGLDTEADDAVWEALEPSHPQYGMARLLARLGISRGAVRPWPAPGIAGTPGVRTRLINRALRPAEAMTGWRDGIAGIAREAVAGVTRIDAPGPEDEARIIALVLREALETPRRTAALVTPDRGLARRVAAELGRWGIALDDSAGRPLMATAPGAFLRLTIRMVAERLAPVPLLSALKHPLAAGGMAPAAFRAGVRGLERRVLRGPRPAPGIAGLGQAIGDAPDLGPLLERLGEVLRPLLTLMEGGPAAFGDLVRAHITAAESLAADDAGAGAARLWAGEAGEAAAAFVADLLETAAVLDPVAPSDYAPLFETLAAGRMVRPRHGLHPRLNVWGLLEARLQKADLLVLGGLNEGTWPSETHAGPWMSRPMMEAFGLPLPERRIGLAAHDFVQAFAAPAVVVTRATRVEGTPTVPSRWLSRLETLLLGSGAEGALASDSRWLSRKESLDAPDLISPLPPPAPRPPVAARPRALSVTQVETWMRDPYALYARHILGLEALHPLDADPGADDYGTFIHAALDRFLKESRGLPPVEALARLLAIGRETLGAVIDRPGVWAFWWPRFEQVARWFVATEEARRSEVAASFTEVRGSLALDAPAGPFLLSAKADRLDLLADGTLAIIDYKTGSPPKPREVAAGFAPQLPLEGAIAAAGGFPGVPARPVSVLDFWQLSGGEKGGERKPAGTDVQALAATALEGLQALIAAFDFPDTPYESRPRPDAAPRFSDYEHLARLKEWSAGGGEGED